MTRARIERGLRATGVGLATLAAVLALAWSLNRLDPLPPISMQGAQVVVAEDGTPLRNFPSRDGAWRYPIQPGQVSPDYLDALLGYEDRWFYWHPGVNPAAWVRAAWQWARAGRIVSGGSTITMQVARLVDPALSGPDSRRLSVKLRQAWRALQLEARYSKDDILALYMTYAPMGGIVEGVEMGARIWLGKSAQSLSPGEAALMTALPQQPSRLRPDRHPQAARAARDKVIARLQDQGVWTAEQADDARMEPVVAPPLAGRWLAPLAAERVRREVRAIGGEAAASGVLRTTLDADLQAVAESLVLDRVGGLPPRVSMAVMVMENDSLAVRAYVGSADFDDALRASHVDMILATRSPGSTLKPFLYAMALDDGLIHSESMLLDAPLSFGGYAPGNFQAGFMGPVSASDALLRSLNVPAVDLLDRIGPGVFASRLMAAGVPIALPAGAEPSLALILGGGGTTLEALVGAYRSLAVDGLAGKPRLQPEAPRVQSRMMSPGAAWIVREVLEGGGHPDRPFDAGRVGRRLAWKTGTSFGFRDAWTVGVTDRWTIGVWVGRPDGTPNPGFFGAGIAAPLARDLALALPDHPGTPRARPSSVSVQSTCWPKGVPWRAELADQCEARRPAWVLDGTVPPTFAEYDGQRERLIRLTGVRDGEVLRPVPGEREVRVTLDADHTQGERWWMVDGQVVGRTAAGQSFTVVLNRNGRRALTVMDKQGRHTSVNVEITGVTW